MDVRRIRFSKTVTLLEKEDDWAQFSQFRRSEVRYRNRSWKWYGLLLATAGRTIRVTFPNATLLASFDICRCLHRTHITSNRERTSINSTNWDWQRGTKDSKNSWQSCCRRVTIVPPTAWRIVTVLSERFDKILIKDLTNSDFLAWMYLTKSGKFNKQLTAE